MIKKIVYTLGIYLGFVFSLHAQTTNHAAYSLFVISFTRYASWPQANGDFKITVLGKTKIYDELLKMTANKNVNGLTYKVSQVESVSEIGDSQIVFVPDNKSSHLDEVIRATEGKAVMVVTEREGLVRKGAGLSFVIIDDKLRFDINNSELEKRNVRVSGNLISLANSKM